MSLLLYTSSTEMVANGLSFICHLQRSQPSICQGGLAAGSVTGPSRCKISGYDMRRTDYGTGENHKVVLPLDTYVQLLSSVRLPKQSNKHWQKMEILVYHAAIDPWQRLSYTSGAGLPAKLHYRC
jgi:hypothetical protein